MQGAQTHAEGQPDVSIANSNGSLRQLGRHTPEYQSPKSIVPEQGDPLNERSCITSGTHRKPLSHVSRFPCLLAGTCSEVMQWPSTPEQHGVKMAVQIPAAGPTSQPESQAPVDSPVKGSQQGAQTSFGPQMSVGRSLAFSAIAGIQVEVHRPSEPPTEEHVAGV